MNATHTAPHDDLESLLAELGMTEHATSYDPDLDESNLSREPITGCESDSIIEAAESDSLEALLSGLDDEPTVEAQSVVTDIVEPVADVVCNTAKSDWEGSVRDLPGVKAEKPVKVKAPKAPKEPKVAKSPTVFWGKNKFGRLEAGLGSKLKDYLLLTMSEATLEGEALEVQVADNTDMFKRLGSKVQNRATNLIEFAAGKRDSLNEVIEITIKLLASDGQLTTGDKGNVIEKLVARPYSLNTARATGNNTIAMLRHLKLVDLGAKGVLIPNPDSLLLQVVASKLALDFGQDDIDAEDNVDVAVAHTGEVSDVLAELPVLSVAAVELGTAEDVLELQINAEREFDLADCEEAPF